MGTASCVMFRIPIIQFALVWAKAVVDRHCLSQCQSMGMMDDTANASIPISWICLALSAYAVTKSASTARMPAVDTRL
jgi:hypothetical protein